MRKLLLALFALFSIVPALHAEILVDIDAGNTKPLPVAIMDFAGDRGLEVSDIIKSNLRRSGVFAPIPKSAFIDKRLDVREDPAFENWSVLNAAALSYGRAWTDGDKVKVEFKLFDVPSRRLLASQTFSADAGNRRRIAHIISDVVYSRLTGDKGFFDTRIVYVAETGPKTDRVRRLAIMDQDGANLKYLTTGKIPVTTPAFSPNSQKIAFTSFHEGEPPRVYTYDLETGAQELVGAFEGMSFAPRFSPDGKKLIMSIAADGNTEIFSFDLGSKKLERLTRHIAIDTAPSYSPDGKKIAFVSDRSGSPQVYTMGADGSNVRRISYGAGQYGDVAWSPRGDYIAFVKILKNRFYVGVMFEDGTGERIIADGYTAESPAFSPNGRRIVFYEESPYADGDSDLVLHSVDITGFGHETIKTPTRASDPAWSPLLE